MNIWSFQKKMTLRLLSWAGVSILAGGILSRLNDQLIKGVGMQAIGWGLVNAGIAIFGGMAAKKRMNTLPDALDIEVQQKETAKLARLLWINTALDVLYMLGGISLIRSRGRTDPKAAGHGWGIMIQGEFLFWFDLIHALMLGTKRQKHL